MKKKTNSGLEHETYQSSQKPKCGTPIIVRVKAEPTKRSALSDPPWTYFAASRIGQDAVMFVDVLESIKLACRRVVASTILNHGSMDDGNCSHILQVGRRIRDGTIHISQLDAGCRNGVIAVANFANNTLVVKLGVPLDE